MAAIKQVLGAIPGLELVELDELFDILQDFHHGLAGDEPTKPKAETTLVDVGNAEPLGRAV